MNRLRVCSLIVLAYSAFVIAADKIDPRLATMRKAWIEPVDELGDDRLVTLAREMTYIDNAMYRDINSCDVLTASNGLRKLRHLGVLKPHGRGSATFYTFSPAVYANTANPKDKGPLSLGLNPQDRTRVPISPEVIALLKRVGERGDARLVDIAILRLCSGRPLSLSDLSKYVGRHPVYLQTFTKRLVAEGSLNHEYPEVPSHPRQRYVTSPLFGDVPIPGDAKRRVPNKSGREPRLF